VRPLFGMMLYAYNRPAAVIKIGTSELRRLTATSPSLGRSDRTCDRPLLLLHEKVTDDPMTFRGSASTDIERTRKRSCGNGRFSTAANGATTKSRNGARDAHPCHDSAPALREMRVSEHGVDTDPQRTHRLRHASGRDPHEHGRTATTLELLYDLVFVVAIGQAAPAPS
jgi:hypothetical protein